MEIIIIVLIAISLCFQAASLWLLLGISGFLMRMADAIRAFPPTTPEPTPQQQNTIDLMQ